MPKTSWLTGPDLMIEKRRASKRADMDRRRTQNKPAVSHTNKIKTRDSSWSQDKCRAKLKNGKTCNARISFTTIDGELIPLDWGTLR